MHISAIANAQYQKRSCFGPFRSYFLRSNIYQSVHYVIEKTKNGGVAKVDRRGNTIYKKGGRKEPLKYMPA